MAISNENRLGIIFTVAFTGFMLVLNIVLSNESLSKDIIPISAGSAVILSIVSYQSYKNKSKKKIQILSHSSYLFFFCLGILLGVGIRYGLGIQDTLDFQNISPDEFFYIFSLALGGLSGFLFFTGMTMAVSVLNIPYIKEKIPGDSVWIPLIGGVTIGFGIMVFLDFSINGIPKICC